MLVLVMEELDFLLVLFRHVDKLLVGGVLPGACVVVLLLFLGCHLVLMLVNQLLLLVDELLLKSCHFMLQCLLLLLTKIMVDGGGRGGGRGERG